MEGWDRGMSLKEVEQAIKTKSEERLKLYNFLRPSKRETIGGQIDYLKDVKKEIQKQLAAKEVRISKDLGLAQARYETATKEVQDSQQARSLQGKGMPLPQYNREELAKLSDIATRNRDAQLLGYVYNLVRDKLLENPSQEALSRAKGRAVMARMEMLKAAERCLSAVQFGDFRQLPRRDEQGLDHTKSIKEVSPKNALETIIRHFTDSPERKREGRELTHIAGQEVRRAEELSVKARDYSVTVDRILDDYCRVAGVSAKQVAPTLNAEEIAHVREFSDKLPMFSTTRKEFTEAARLAEFSLHERKTADGLQERMDPGNPPAQPREPSSSQQTASTERSDRDNSWRGR